MKILCLVKNLVFPKQCFSCNAWGSFLCRICSDRIPLVKHQRCIECQKSSLLGLTHPKCKTKFLPERLITIFNYQQPLIQQMINTGKLAMIPGVFAELAVSALSKIEISSLSMNNFVFCTIPMSMYKQKFRGFNQSQIIALQFSKNFHLAVDNLLIKNNFIKQQKLLDKQARSENIKEAFRLINNKALPTHVILIDDVTTTGSTFKAASRVLKEAGVSIVWCLALAQD
jgi:competence protein ComFC